MKCAGCQDCIEQNGLFPNHHCHWTGATVYPGDRKTDDRGGYNCPLDMLAIRRKAVGLWISERDKIGIIGSIVDLVDGRGLLAEFLDRHSNDDRMRLIGFRAAYRIQEIASSR